MTRMFATLLGALALSAFTACWPVGVAGDVVVDEGYPPAAYIATSTPVYYGGYPNYWYGGRWYSRYGGGWHAYREEPGYLHDYRYRAAPARQYYGRGSVGVVYGRRHR